MAALTRAQRVAANRAAITVLLAPADDFTVHGVAVRPVSQVSAPGRLEYVEIGQCGGCRLSWRTNEDGAVKLHGPTAKRCKGSYEMPLARALVLKDLYRAGEKWPKRRM